MKRTILLIAALLSCVPISAQMTGKRESLPLSFEEALDITMSDNPRIAASKYEEKAAMQERKAAFGLRLPQLGVTGAYAHLGDDIAVNLNSVRDTGAPIFQGVVNDLINNGIPVNPDLINAGNALFRNNWGIKLLDKDLALIGGTVKMPLYTGGKINAANRAAKINEKTAIEKGEQVKAELMSELVERYYGLLLAYHAVLVREQVVEAMEEHLRDAVALEQNGIIASSERIYMEVKLAEAERDLLDARSQAATTASALNNTLNIEQNVSPISNMFILTDLPALYTFKELAMGNNHLLKQVELKKELAVQGAKAQRAEFMPQVAAIGGANIYNYHMPKSSPDWFVGVGVQFKIFDGLNREYKYSAAKNTVRQVESLQTKAEKDIDLLIEKLYNELMNYSDRMPSIDKTLEFATEYLRVKNAGFKEGVATSVDVIDAELNLAKTRIERLQTAFGYDVALAKLLEAAGTAENFITYAKGSYAIPIKFE